MNGRRKGRSISTLYLTTTLLQWTQEMTANKVYFGTTWFIYIVKGKRLLHRSKYPSQLNFYRERMLTYGQEIFWKSFEKNCHFLQV